MTAEVHSNPATNPQRLIFAALGLGVLLVAVGWMMAGGFSGESTPNGAFVTQFFRSYLVAWFFWWAIAIGSLMLLLLHNLTGGAWGFAIRPNLLAAAGTLPLVALLFVPIPLFGLEHLYEWSDEALVMSDPILAHKAPYLNPEWFVIRAGAYWIVWLSALFFARRTSLSAPDSDTAARRIRVTSGIAIGLTALAVTFASFDYGMSLEPHWYSTIYGVLFFVAHGLAAMAFAIAVLVHWPRGERPTPINPDTLHDLGKLMFAFTMIWAYVSFSQFLIIWYGNLPEEIPWYIRRTSHGWEFVAIAIALFQFAFPFLVLLGRRIKRQPGPLAAIALWILGMRLVDLIWLVEPAFERTGVFIPWLDVGLTAIMGAIWLAVFHWQRPNDSAWPTHERGAFAQ
jgi:hypothetical protein